MDKITDKVSQFNHEKRMAYIRLTCKKYGLMAKNILSHDELNDAIVAGYYRRKDANFRRS